VRAGADMVETGNGGEEKRDDVAEEEEDLVGHSEDGGATTPSSETLLCHCALLSTTMFSLLLPWVSGLLLVLRYSVCGRFLSGTAVLSLLESLRVGE